MIKETMVKNNLFCAVINPVKSLCITFLLLFSAASTQAASVPNTFSNGTTADASEVNANFAALADAITALENQLASATTSADLSGKTYCMVYQNASLLPNGPRFGIGNGKARLNFTNSTQGEFTVLSDNITELWLEAQVETNSETGHNLYELISTLFTEADNDISSITYSLSGDVLRVNFGEGETQDFFMAIDGSTITDVAREVDSFERHYYEIIVGTLGSSC